MSLRELVDGDCGGPGPLTSFTTHLVQDRGFRDDGIGQSRVVPFESAGESQLVDEFLDSRANAIPQTFRMNNIIQEIHDIDQSIPALPQTSRNFHDTDTEWACQFLENRSEFYENNSDRIWAENIHRPPPAAQQDANEFGLGLRWAEDYFEHSLEKTDNKTDELKLKNDNDTLAYSKFMKFMHQDGEISELTKPSTSLSAEWTEEFVQSDKYDNADHRKREIDQSGTGGTWANEFADGEFGKKDSSTGEFAEWSKLQDEWNKVSNSEINESHPWMSDYESYYDPYKDYKFAEDNPMKDIDNALEKGKERLHAGDLPSAVLCFEAAVQQDGDNPEAWLLLGRTQAENEQDPLAIPALKKCLTLDDKNLSALMTLAVSYTNESYQNQACLVLKEWLMKNDKYNKVLSFKPSSKSSTNSVVSSYLADPLHKDVQDLFIQAARINPTNEIDADVQSGLGVLFNLSNEYDKAVDCFNAALQVRPDDSRLWNRLGATLANGQKSAEAIDAYSKSLELSPGFIRARYNLGISCINLMAYQEAAEHLLTALNQQAAARGVRGQMSTPSAMSETIWSTLRLVINLMKKFDLFEPVEKRDLDKLNQAFEIS